MIAWVNRPIETNTYESSGLIVSDLQPVIPIILIWELKLPSAAFSFAIFHSVELYGAMTISFSSLDTPNDSWYVRCSIVLLHTELNCESSFESIV